MEAYRTRQELRDLKEERAAEAWQALYDQIKAEREAAGRDDRPAVIVAEINRRLREEKESLA